MSLEAKIELLTAAVTELTRVTAAQHSVKAVSASLEDIKHPVTAVDVKANNEEGETLMETKKRLQKEGVPNAEPESSTPELSQASAPTGEPSSPALTYKDDVKPATLKLSQQEGREVAIAVLARFGVKGAQELAEAQWAEYVAHVEKVLAGGEV